MPKTIDLGTSPVNPESMATVVEIDDAPVKINYPSLYISGRENLDDAPSTGSEGTAVIQFRVISKSESDREKNGASVKESSLELEVKSIAFESSPKPPSQDDSEDEIEEGLKEAELKSKEKPKKKEEKD